MQPECLCVYCGQEITAFHRRFRNCHLTSPLSSDGFVGRLDGASTEWQRWRMEPSDFIQVPGFTNKLLGRWRSVARVDGPDRVLGTGFLISHDLLLTNHHIISS